MDAYILSGVRTPMGKLLGSLAEIPAPKLAAAIIPEAIKRAGVEADQFDEVIFGNVLQASLGQNPARQAALFAGLSQTTPAFTVNKVCGSGLKSVMLAAQAIKAGDANIVLAGGMENMTRAPHFIEGMRTGIKYGDGTIADAMIRDGLWCPFENWAMGRAAEHTATQCNITREAQDAFAVESHRRAANAWEAGAFEQEVIPITVGTGTKAKIFKQDEGIRPESTVDSLSKLRPAFEPGKTVTAANASQISDGAAALVVASGLACETRGLKPLAKIVSYATSGVAPKDLFTAPILAIRMAISKANLALDQIGLFEINEAFAAQMLACCNELNLDMAKVNVNGGGVALGHPIGASGARILVTLIHSLRSKHLRFGVASLCLGGGNAVAMVIEAIE